MSSPRATCVSFLIPTQPDITSCEVAVASIFAEASARCTATAPPWRDRLRRQPSPLPRNEIHALQFASACEIAQASHKSTRSSRFSFGPRRGGPLPWTGCLQRHPATSHLCGLTLLKRCTGQGHQDAPGHLGNSNRFPSLGRRQMSLAARAALSAVAKSWSQRGTDAR